MMALPPLELRKTKEPTPHASFSGFPVRSLTRNVEGRAGGEWVLAYQMEQKKRLKLTVGSVIGVLIDGEGDSIRLTAPKNTPAITSAHVRHLLDKKLLMKISYVDRPSDLCTVSVSGLNLKHYKDSDFSAFDSLVRILASDNQLPLEAFQLFPVLQELELSLNDISHINFTPESFSTLKTLDLSYNYLTNASITMLGLLPQLVELHLTGNSIVSLPSNMSRPQTVHTNTASKIKVTFPRLERLWLDDNSLSDATTFAILAGLRRLKYLNLDKNELFSIPHLKLLGTGPLKEHSSSSSLKTSETNSLSHPPSNAEVDLSSLAPFPQLQTLSICSNMIINGNNLLPCGSWPMLKELIIIGNPIVSMHKGIPDLLQHELVEKCSINIIRNSQEGNKKHPIVKRSKEFIKVSTSPPPLIPKRPLLLAIESAPTTDSSQTDELLSNFSENESISDGSTTQSQFSQQTRKSEGDQPEEGVAGPGVFLTEPGVLAEDENNIETENNQTDTKSFNKEITSPSPSAVVLPSVKEEFDKKRQEERERFSNIPTKYKGFESLLNVADDKYDDSPPVPKDTHNCAKVLKYALNYPLVLKQPQQSSEQVAPPPASVLIGTTGQYLKKTPTLNQYHTTRAISCRQREVDSLLKDLKSHQVSVEANLQDILHQKRTMRSLVSSRKTSPTHKPAAVTDSEGQQLFDELQAKYNRVREVSLETLAAIDSAQKVAQMAIDTNNRYPSS